MCCVWVRRKVLHLHANRPKFRKSILRSLPFARGRQNQPAEPQYVCQACQAEDPIPLTDIFEINPFNLPDFDMLCAGFPCQPFSAAGKELGFKDSRGTVFFRLMSVIEAKKPQIVFLENVPNLVRHDKGRTFRVITEKLTDAGYCVSSAILDSAYFWNPSKPFTHLYCGPS